MLERALLASAEAGINRALRLDATALPRLAQLSGAVIEIDCPRPARRLFILPGSHGLTLAGHWEAPATCTLRAPAGRLLELAVRRDKTAVLHSADVELEGDSSALTALTDVLQNLELDWEHEVSRWLGPVGTALLSGHVRLRAQWAQQGAGRLRETLADYLNEETRALVGKREAEARWQELDELKLATDRIEARLARLFPTPDSSENA
ncbi:MULTISPECIES: SCP2 domain-containing protein [unclassified Pseudomonas]|uniref:ubiquinone biosynthesis accessory factor UbiJ n=1 Tax=unclassified Pseudomonas TaxID=196821 RepID=UPI000BD95D21|nr:MULTISPECIES: SCP2 sterol-binding domain-containing protein [unclassified Pseudomonas]PVZ09664.1 ubiquinone biosynthesis protein UbiJ [Pseudomonas sp. URIL14HWK12:I12]PVZ21580.1 ubiquinone biosynthesis protein UbiJ [Pseudomonas sp. URIL14HWK12:I10]PVZ30239.1 ubiquinone biosynthesis protein UbiJ [Pseudomonas sp. URIL14HWK12:I11]SNZ18822.1 ubiquinone biosynthesis protein UbiJ [Pseudomonas sp. URIL14HWK12:I9]